MVWRNGSRATKLTPPHDISGKSIEGHMPEGEGADRILALMKRSQEIMRDHPVNQARRNAGKTEATSAWFWGQGTRPAVPTLKERFGVDGSVISAVDLVNGLGRLAGLELITVPGATGFLDTDYGAKARYGLKSLEKKDFLLLHIEAPDEAGHMGRADLKTEAIERIDELIMGPMLEGLNAMGEFRLLIQPDHATPSKLKTHSSEAVPFAIISNRSFVNGGAKSRRYTETDAKAAGVALNDGYRLIETLFGRSGVLEAD
jgi:2,3-bisphosphoglycerate-independent phosphoglycerate mutase